MQGLYNKKCDCCGGWKTELSAEENNIVKFKEGIFERAIKHIHKKGSYKPEMLADKPFLDVITETNRILKSPLEDLGIEVPEVMREKLRNDVFVFSGLKTHAQLKEAASWLLTPEGKIKSFPDFRKDVWQVHSSYNSLYLEAEYIFATSSAQMAAKWVDFEKDGDRYNLQYRTAGDEKVRDSHAAINLTTLPVDDAFWNSYFPPNGWRCRCTAVQVRVSKYPESNSKEAIAKGEKATTHINKKGENTDEIFRFNPGRQKVIFPPKHPYRNVQDRVKRIVEELPAKQEAQKELKTIQDLSEHIELYSKKHPECFANGFKKIEFESNLRNNGSTDKQGNIWLKKDRVNWVIDAINNINKGVNTTFEQEDSLSTLWHEITHNRNGIKTTLTSIERGRMELANEFVSRKTLPIFMEQLGGKLQNESLIKDRESTGYNLWVRKYDMLIDFTGADLTKVVEHVQKHLTDESYKIQTKGLVNAIANNATKKFAKTDIKNAVIECTGKMSENEYGEWLNTLKEKSK